MYFVHVYIYIYIYFFFFLIQKEIQDFQIFPKKRENFSKKKKKKFFELGALDFLVTFFKKDLFFFFQRFQDSLKSSFKMVHENPLDKTFFRSEERRVGKEC